MDKCPKCGDIADRHMPSGIDHPAYTVFRCDTIVPVIGGIDEGYSCLRRQLAAANERVGELERALIRLRDCDWTITLPDRMGAVRDIARKALGGGK